jgi:uncharacterized protein
LEIDIELPMKNYFVKIFSNTYSITEAQKETTPRNNFITFCTCIIACFCLTFSEYWSNKSCFYSAVHFLNFDTKLYNDFRDKIQLLELLWWAGTIIFFYFVIPFITIKFLYKQKLSDYGVQMKNAFASKKLYLILFLIVTPLVIICSYTPSFQNRYPFYLIQNKNVVDSNFLIWEFVYLFQFFAVEFFFRGFLLHGTKKSMGFFSVLLCTIPYCMIHFHKPLPEALAAIVAGIILSTLSLKNNSIWLGVVIHISIALLMDVCALWQKGLL